MYCVYLSGQVVLSTGEPLKLGPRSLVDVIPSKPSPLVCLSTCFLIAVLLLVLDTRSFSTAFLYGTASGHENQYILSSAQI